MLSTAHNREHVPLTLTLRRWEGKQEGQEFKVIFTYIVSLRLKRGRMREAKGDKEGGKEGERYLNIGCFYAIKN